MLDTRKFPFCSSSEEEALIVKTRLYAIIGEHGSRVRQTLRVIGTKTRAANDPSVFTNMVEIFWLKEPTRAFLGNIQVLRIV